MKTSTTWEAAWQSSEKWEPLSILNGTNLLICSRPFTFPRFGHRVGMIVSTQRWVSLLGGIFRLNSVKAFANWGVPYVFASFGLVKSSGGTGGFQIPGVHGGVRAWSNWVWLASSIPVGGKARDMLGLSVYFQSGSRLPGISSIQNYCSWEEGATSFKYLHEVRPCRMSYCKIMNSS